MQKGEIKMKKHLITLVMLIVMFANVDLANGMQRVFILDSYEQNHVCGKPQHDGVVAALEKMGFIDGKNISIESYYMDTKKINTTAAQKKQQAEIASRKITEFKPHVLVTIDDTAFKTVALPLVDTDIKIVFSGMNGQPENYNKMKPFMESRQTPGHNVTGVYEFLHIADAIRVHSKIFPQLIETRVIVDTVSPTGRAILKQVELELAETDYKYSIRNVTSWEEYKQAIEEANNDSNVSVIYPVALALNDTKGNRYTAPKIFAYTVDNSTKPELALNYFFCKIGLFGGAAVDFGKMGWQAGEKVAKILKGASPGSLPIENATEHALAFNYTRAKELGIKIPGMFLDEAKVYLNEGEKH